MRRKHHRAYGCIYDESTSSSICERIGQGKSASASAKLPDNLMALQSQMKGCLLNDAGSLQYYLDPSTRALKENGDASDITGGDGQVMVEIPLGWLKYWYEDSQHHYLISKEQFSGANRLDAFYKNDEWIKNRYQGAYEGTLYDVSTLNHVNGVHLLASSTVFNAAAKTITQSGRSHPFTNLEIGDKLVITGTINNNATVTVASGGDQVITASEVLVNETANAVISTQRDWINDKLCSVSGKAPITQGTRNNFRVISNRGTGWRQQDYDLISTIQLLYLVEYSDFNSQAKIGNGLTDWNTAWTAWNDYNPIEKTGLSNSVGNATGNVSNGNGIKGSYMSYRGIENFYGHLWGWVDGINILFGSGTDYTGQPYVSNKDTDFADNISTNYMALQTIPGRIADVPQNGYAKTLGQQSRGLLPASIGGSPSTYITDYYYQNTGWRVARLGGSASNGATAGVACWYLLYSSGDAIRVITGRLSY